MSDPSNPRTGPGPSQQDDRTRVSERAADGATASRGALRRLRVRLRDLPRAQRAAVLGAGTLTAAIGALLAAPSRRTSEPDELTARSAHWPGADADADALERFDKVHAEGGDLSEFSGQESFVEQLPDGDVPAWPEGNPAGSAKTVDVPPLEEVRPWPEAGDDAAEDPYVDFDPAAPYEMPPEGIAVYTTAPVADLDTTEMTFDEAFAAAREAVGAGGWFAFEGAHYNTYLREEWRAMSPEQHADYFASYQTSAEPVSLAADDDAGLVDAAAAEADADHDPFEPEAIEGRPLRPVETDDSALEVVDAASVGRVTADESLRIDDEPSDGGADAIVLDPDQHSETDLVRLEELDLEVVSMSDFEVPDIPTPAALDGDSGSDVDAAAEDVVEHEGELNGFDELEPGGTSEIETEDYNPDFDPGADISNLLG